MCIGHQGPPVHTPTASQIALVPLFALQGTFDASEINRWPGVWGNCVRITLFKGARWDGQKWSTISPGFVNSCFTEIEFNDQTKSIRLDWICDTPPP